MKELRTPFPEADILGLRAGEAVRLSGVLYTARDAAHARILRDLDEGKTPPLPLHGQVIYYTGPTPPPPGRVIGACGPTTSSRMDPYVPAFLRAGLKGMIGKGPRSETVKEACRGWKAVYFVAVGGAGALIARSVVSCRLLAYEDLGPEAVYELVVKDVPLWVAIDTEGNDVFEAKR